MNTWDRLTTLLHAAPGEYSVCVWTAQGQPIFSYNADVIRPAASLIKVPLAMALVDAQPQIKLDTALTLAETDRVEGDGTFDRAPAGTIKTVHELIGHALIESDNTAANLLINCIGFAAVNRWLAARGFQTRLRRKFMDYAARAAGRDNTTTAADMCALFYRLQQPAYAELMALLTQVKGDQKLEAGLPPDVMIAHKLGDLPDIEHDAGIIFAPTPYIIAALSANLPDIATGRHTIATASRLIWERMTINN